MTGVVVCLLPPLPPLFLYLPRRVSRQSVCESVALESIFVVNNTPHSLGIVNCSMKGAGEHPHGKKWPSRVVIA